MMQGVHARLAQGRGQLGHKGKCGFVWIRASEIPLHICPITAHQHQAEAREQRGVHLSLFDSMFNDRLTKGLQMRAGVISPSSRLPLQCKRAYCASPDHNRISLKPNEETRSVSESSRKLGRFCCFCSNRKRFFGNIHHVDIKDEIVLVVFLHSSLWEKSLQVFSVTFPHI